MSHRGRFRPGDDRLGRVLGDVVEGGRRPPVASLASAGVGARAFTAALEQRTERPRPSGERPRFGALFLTAVLGAAVAAALALWPAVSSHRTTPGQPAPAAAQRDGVHAAVAPPAAAGGPTR